MILFSCLASPPITASSKSVLNRLTDAQALRLARVVPVEEMLSDDGPYREMQSMGIEVMLVDWPSAIRTIICYRGDCPALDELLPMYRKVILELTGGGPCVAQTVH